MRSSRLDVILVLAMVGAMGVRSPARAQVSSPPVTPEVSYVFGEQITIQASFPPDLVIQEVYLFVELETAPGTMVAQAVPDENGQVVFTLDVSEHPVQAFSQVKYRFRTSLAGNQVAESEWFTFDYEDNRFQWRSLEKPPFEVHWVEGDVEVAQFALDAAQVGMQQMQAIIPADPPEHVNIYLYGNLLDYQFARGQLGQLWAGGHTRPEAGLILIASPPGPEQRLEIESSIPHEVAHIMLYQALGEGVDNLPSWLNEGVASVNELYPNPDYRFLIDYAYKNGELLPLSSLCPAFPRDASRALLSYAEADSVVRYLQQTYGNAGIEALLREYARGVGCDQGTLVPPVEMTLSRVERAWRGAVFSENFWLTALNAMLPWLVLFAVVSTGPLILLIGSWRKSRDPDRREGTG